MRRLLYLVVVGIGACHSPAEEKGQRSEPTVSAQVVAPTIDAAVAAIDARAADPAEALHLPHRDVDATKIIGATKEEVTRALGGSDSSVRSDGSMIYRLADGEFVVVLYERGRAVGIELPTAKPGWAEYNEDQRNALAAWGHVNDNPQIRGHHVVLGDDLARGGLAIYEKEYRKRAQAKLDAEQAAREAAQRRLDAEQARRDAARARAEAAEAARLAAAQEAEAARAAKQAAAAEKRRADMRPAREGFIEVIAQEMAKAGFGFNLELGSPDTTLRVVGPCNRGLLGKLVELAGQNMRNVAFERIECGSNASIGIDL
jgi:hypothetical protein